MARAQDVLIIMGQSTRRSPGSYGRSGLGVLRSGRTHRCRGKRVSDIPPGYTSLANRGKRIPKSCTVLFQGLPAQRTKLLKREPVGRTQPRHGHKGPRVAHNIYSFYLFTGQAGDEEFSPAG